MGYYGFGETILSHSPPPLSSTFPDTFVLDILAMGKETGLKCEIFGVLHHLSVGTGISVFGSRLGSPLGLRGCFPLSGTIDCLLMSQEPVM